MPASALQKLLASDRIFSSSRLKSFSEGSATPIGMATSRRSSARFFFDAQVDEHLLDLFGQC